MNEGIYQELCRITGSRNVFPDEPMSRHTTFHIGGPADCLVCPQSADEIFAVMRVCREYSVPVFILGRGSNLLVSDGGYRGVVLQIYRNFSDIRTEGNTVQVHAGALLSAVARRAVERSLSGFEFAAGIPGTMGGAVTMNAGAYGGEIKDILVGVKVLTGQGEIREMSAKELCLGYRTSIVRTEEYVVLEAHLRLEPGDQESITDRIRELAGLRSSKQPLEYPSAGSTFKRPEGCFAGKLIMDAGLRGYRVGDAQVSEKHCGFVVNRGHATAADVRQLMADVTDRVQEKFGICLEPEVKLLGDFDM